MTEEYCPLCEGEGLDADDETRPCTVCGGTGKVDLDDPVIKKYFERIKLLEDNSLSYKKGIYKFTD